VVDLELLRPLNDDAVVVRTPGSGHDPASCLLLDLDRVPRHHPDAASFLPAQAIDGVTPR